VRSPWSTSKGARAAGAVLTGGHDAIPAKLGGEPCEGGVIEEVDPGDSVVRSIAHGSALQMSEARYVEPLVSPRERKGVRDVQPRKVHPLIRDAVLLLDVLEGIDGSTQTPVRGPIPDASAAVMLPPPE